MMEIAHWKRNVPFSRIPPDGIGRVGTDYGYGRNTYPHILVENDAYIVARVPAHSDWAGIGTTERYPAYLIVLQKAGRDKEDRELFNILEDDIEYDKHTRVATIKATLERYGLLEERG